MKSGYNLSIFILLLFFLSGTGCRDQQNDNFDFSGEWTIESYRITTEINSEVINDQTEEDAGFFRFLNGGSGMVTILVPGVSLVDNPISWSFDQENEELTIDYQTGQDPFNYEVSFHPGDRVTLFYELITQTDESNSIFRNTIKLAKTTK